MLYALLVLFLVEHVWVLWYLNKQLRIAHAKLLVNNALSNEKLKLSFLALEKNLYFKLDALAAKTSGIRQH